MRFEFGSDDRSRGRQIAEKQTLGTECIADRGVGKFCGRKNPSIVGGVWPFGPRTVEPCGSPARLHTGRDEGPREVFTGSPEGVRLTFPAIDDEGVEPVTNFDRQGAGVVGGKVVGGCKPSLDNVYPTRDESFTRPFQCERDEHATARGKWRGIAGLDGGRYLGTGGRGAPDEKFDVNGGMLPATEVLDGDCDRSRGVNEGDGVGEANIGNG
jgi:hypothetical protein